MIQKITLRTCVMCILTDYMQGNIINAWVGVPEGELNMVFGNLMYVVFAVVRQFFGYEFLNFCLELQL